MTKKSKITSPPRKGNGQQLSANQSTVMLPRALQDRTNQMASSSIACANSQPILSTQPILSSQPIVSQQPIIASNQSIQLNQNSQLDPVIRESHVMVS